MPNVKRHFHNQQLCVIFRTRCLCGMFDLTRSRSMHDKEIVLSYGVRASLIFPQIKINMSSISCHSCV